MQTAALVRPKPRGPVTKPRGNANIILLMVAARRKAARKRKRLLAQAIANNASGVWRANGHGQKRANVLAQAAPRPATPNVHIGGRCVVASTSGSTLLRQQWVAYRAALAQCAQARNDAIPATIKAQKAAAQSALQMAVDV